ncbi:MAG: ISNCY family transposase, partial [Lachnospiraceae bacterium]
SFCLGDRKTQNAKTLHADLLLAGITQLITVVVADRVHKPEFFRSLKRLIA